MGGEMKYETSFVSLDIETKDGNCEASLAEPTETGRYPGVLFLMDAFGSLNCLNFFSSR